MRGACEHLLNIFAIQAVRDTGDASIAEFKETIRAAIGDLADVIDGLKDKPVLTVADSPGVSQQGVVLNMNVKDDKITFEANLTMARKAGLSLSSQLLRLATKIQR